MIRNWQHVRPLGLCFGTLRKQHCDTLMLRCGDGHLQEKCELILKTSFVAHLDGSISFTKVKGSLTNLRERYISTGISKIKALKTLRHRMQSKEGWVVVLSCVMTGHLIGFGTIP